MPAMWDRLQMRTAPASATDCDSQPRLQPRKHQLHLARLETHTGQYWQSDFDTRINALGITNEPYRYEIRRGKTVPRPGPVQGEISPPSDLDDDALPFREPPPRNPRRLRAQQHLPVQQPRSDPVRPASSISTEDGLEDRHRGIKRNHSPPAISHPKVAARDMYTRPALEQISPPSSPDVNARHGNMVDDVSPIDEDLDMSRQAFLRGPRHTQPMPTQPPQQQRSSIPTMRRARRKQSQDIAAAALRDARSKDTGNTERQPLASQRPDSRNDAERWEAPPDAPFAGVRASTPEQQSLGFTTTITGPQVHRSTNTPSPSFGQRVRQLGRPKPDPVDTRPAWNGASGRAPLVPAVRDEARVAPLNIPTKNNKRGGRKISAPFASTLSPVSPSGSETSGGVVSGVRKFLPSRGDPKPNPTMQPQPMPILVTGTEGSHSYPSPPLVESPIRMSQPPSEPSGRSPAALLAPETVPSVSKAIKRKPPPPAHANTASHAPHPSTSSSIYSAYPEQATPTSSPYANRTPSRGPAAGSDAWVQPSSRFSITTYATSHASSPRPSVDDDRPPMPTPPQPASVMDRRRPLPAGESPRTSSPDPVVISMKSTYASGLERQNGHPSHFRTLGSMESTDRPISIMSTSKALPPAPPELESVNDRVAHLNARLENLAHRRNNINKSIKQMTELMPTDNLMASAEVLRKREIEKQKVEGLKEELAEVQQEEYDLGLKLHRAYKRLDKNAEYEPTTLWVRRVTG